MAQQLADRPVARSRSGPLRVVGALVVALLVVGAVVVLRGGGSADVRLTSYAVSERQPMRELRGTTLDGAKLDLAQYAGKVVVLNVWGSWCNPCRAEAYALARVARRTAAQGVQFVGVDVREPSRTTAAAYEKKFDVPYPSLEATRDTAPLLALHGILPVSPPGTLVLDRQGRVAARAIGGVTEEQLRDLLEPVVAERA